MSRTRAVIVGCGGYLPSKVLTNDDLAKIVDTSDEWITTRSGIKQRHIAADDQATSDLAVEAAKEALAHAGVTIDDIDLIVVGTTTPDQTLPAVAAIVQAKLGMSHGAALDVQAVCSGFVYGLTVADNFVTSGQFKRALVIGAEKLSSIIDWEDRTTCVLFADGAGAVVLEAQDGAGVNADRGILSSYLRCDGTLKELIKSSGGTSTTGEPGKIQMAGREVFRHAVTNISEAIVAACKKVDIGVDEVDWFVPHQANLRILEGTAKKLKIPHEKVVLTVETHGNTSAASVPLAFNTAVKDGRIQPGQLVLFEAMGGGLTWGSVLVRM